MRPIRQFFIKGAGGELRPIVVNLYTQNAIFPKNHLF